MTLYWKINIEGESQYRSKYNKPSTSLTSFLISDKP